MPVGIVSGSGGTGLGFPARDIPERGWGDWGTSTLLTAAILGVVELPVVAILLEAGAGPDALDRDRGLSPSMFLAERFDHYVAESSWQSGSWFLGEPLTIATAKVLLAAGADVHLRDRRGEIAFDKARRDGFDELVRLMDAFR